MCQPATTDFCCCETYRVVRIADDGTADVIAQHLEPECAAELAAWWMRRGETVVVEVE